jgi:tol-pal system-associated acyl-CoA thioesterase
MQTSTIEIRVYYEDTDSGEMVYYANYLRYFERARTEYLRDLGFSVAEYAQKGTLFVVSSAQIKYIAPAFYDAFLVIETQVTEKKGASLTFSHRVIDKASQKLIVTGSAQLVCVNKQTGKPQKLPEALKTIL